MPRDARRCREASESDASHNWLQELTSTDCRTLVRAVIQKALMDLSEKCPFLSHGLGRSRKKNRGLRLRSGVRHRLHFSVVVVERKVAFITPRDVPKIGAFRSDSVGRNVDSALHSAGKGQKTSELLLSVGGRVANGNRERASKREVSAAHRPAQKPLRDGPSVRYDMPFDSEVAFRRRLIAGIRRAGRAVLEDPTVRQVGDLGDQRQVISTEAGRVLPLFAVLVEPGQRHVVADAAFGLVLPDRRPHAAQADLVDRPLFGLGLTIRSCSCHETISSSQTGNK